MRFQRSWVPGVIAFCALAACGGGGSETSTRASIGSVKVMGDSLADSGTFGFKFTVQSTVAGSPSLVFPERVAQTFGVTLCNHYTATSATTFIVNPTNPACTNYAIGGGRINNPPTATQSIVHEMQDAQAAGSYGAGDLVIIDGGANDAADLIGAFLAVPTDGGASFGGLLVSLLPPASVGAAIAAGPTGAATIGATYMGALADKMAAAITTSVLGNGAQRVAVLNIPSILNTPRLQFVLGAVTAQAGAAASAQYAAVFTSWLEAYNTELAAKFAGNSNVVVVDFYAALNQDVAAPAQFSLQNVTTPVCPVNPTPGPDGLPAYTFPTCTDAALSATPPPAGATGGSDWWKSYLFADSFHPTPYGYDLLARYVSRAIAIAGWI